MTGEDTPILPGEPAVETETTGAPAPGKYASLVKTLIDSHPLVKYQEVLRIAQYGLDTNDLTLSNAAINHVMTRADAGSGDMLHAMVISSTIYERVGKIQQSNLLMNLVLEGRF